MRWTNQRRRQSRVVVALGRVQLRLDKKDDPGQVGTPKVPLRVLDLGSRVLARLQQQEIDASSVLSHVELQEGVRTALGKAIGLPQRPAGLLIAKSAEAAKAGATQHSAKQLAQSARR